MATKPVVSLMFHDDLPAMVRQLQDVAEVRCQSDFLNTRETPLSADDYASVTVMVVDTLVSVDKDLLDRCPKLRVVIRYGIGFDNVDACYAASMGVCVCNIPDYGIEEVADAALSHMLNLFRQTTHFHVQLQNGKCFATDPEKREGAGKAVRRLRGKTLGLIGIGNIGTAVAGRAKAFGLHVIFYDPYVPVGFDKAHGIQRFESVEDVVRRSDCVSLHCALTSETRHIINESILRMFKKEAFLINVSRGALVDEAALAQALREERIAGAGIDVFAQEPFSLKGSVYENVPNLYLTPHVAWYSPDSVIDIRKGCVKIVRYAVSHSDPNGLQSCVNRKLLDLESCKPRWSG